MIHKTLRLFNLEGHLPQSVYDRLRYKHLRIEKYYIDKQRQSIPSKID